jgi:hypothetical protein
VYISLSNSANTVSLGLAEATTMLMVEVKAFKIAIRKDSLKVGYQNPRRPAGPLVAWVSTALRTVLMEDKYVYYYDSNSDKEIQLLVQPCDPDGVPLNRTHDQQIDDARERAAAKAARDEREASRRLRTPPYASDTICPPDSSGNPSRKPRQR